MQDGALEIVGRCVNCYGDSPKAYKKEQFRSMAKVKSEYQEAFKEYCWQPKTQSMKPPEKKITSNEKSRSHIDRKTTYNVDFVLHSGKYCLNGKLFVTWPDAEWRLLWCQPVCKYYSLPKKRIPKKYRSKATAHVVDTTQYQDYFPKMTLVSKLQSPECDNALVIHPSNGHPFQCDTIYNNAYPSYDADTVTACQQAPVKVKDNIEICGYYPPIQQEEEMTETEQSIGSKSVCTTKTDTSSRKEKFEDISTAMADFCKPEGYERPKPCLPPVQTHFSNAKFDDATTFKTAYKPFPVQPYELPIWAKKPKYKRPEGGMVVNSLYMHDYQSPKVIKPPSPIDPRVKQKRNIIMRKDIGYAKCEKTTTYMHDFERWENVRPRESYQTIEIYQPPKEKMMFETNQRSHFKGEKADKMKPCRHISQHRELNTQSQMTFCTTYDETYRDPYLKIQASRSSTRRSCSAKQTTRTSEKISRPATSGTIPKPDLGSLSISNNPVPESVSSHSSMSGDSTAKNSEQSSGHVDILKIDDICAKCKKIQPGCAYERTI